MTALFHTDSGRHRFLFILIALLLLPALLINLGLLAFIDDEGIRALVALEMQLSGNYITPTLHGAFYYNKPPLYNWILLVFFNISGSFDEWSARLATVVCLLGYATTLYVIFQKRYGQKIALLNALLLVTCGRILFWDSMLGLIDICFSWVMFTLFMVIFHYFQRKHWWRLFLLSYLLTAVGFMLKGLPAIVFQGITLGVYFLYKKQFKRLFSIQHIVGGLLFVVLIGSYYAVYNQYNSLSNVFTTLFTESSRRTVVNYGLGDTLLHILYFPFEMTYHFLPWSVLGILFLRKRILHKILQDSFITFCLITFLANIIVYWVSPEVYPRYLLMLAPLYFAVGLYLHPWHQARNTMHYRSLSGFFLLFGLLAVPGSLVPLFLEETASTPYLHLKCGVLFLATATLAWWNYHWKKERLLVLVATLLVIRIGFNWFVLPSRNVQDMGGKLRASAVAMGEKYADEPLWVYKETAIEPAQSFYVTRERNAVVPRQLNPVSDGFYIISPELYRDVSYEKFDELLVRHQDENLLIVRLPNTK